MARGQQAPFSVSSLASPFFLLETGLPMLIQQGKEKGVGCLLVQAANGGTSEMEMASLSRARQALEKGSHYINTNQKFMHQECYLKLCLFFS